MPSNSIVTSNWQKSSILGLGYFLFFCSNVVFAAYFHQNQTFLRLLSSKVYLFYLFFSIFGIINRGKLFLNNILKKFPNTKASFQPKNLYNLLLVQFEKFQKLYLNPLLITIRMIQTLHETKLTYKSSANQGQCILQEIQPIRKIMWRFILYVFLSVCTAGLFALFVYWYPRFQRFLIYDICQLNTSTHFFILNYDDQYTIVGRTEQIYYQNEEQSCKVDGFVNRYMKYVIYKGVICAVDFQYRKRIACILKNTKKGLDNLEAQKLRECYGPGTMIIQRPNVFVLFGRQVFRPLYLFIIFSVSLWVYEKYYYYAGVIFVTSTVSIAINLYQIRQLNEKIFHMAYYDIPLHVLRKDQVLQISSVQVVPGDIVFLKQPIKLPFEGVILEGSALINECALTGESVPIVKKADIMEKYRNENVQLDKSAYIFQGTTIIQVNMKKKMNKFQQFRQAYGIPVCVIRTNFVTLKGQLIRIISFPREQQNDFQKQSTRFLIFFFGLAVSSYLILIIKLHDIVSAEDMIVKFLDLITITVPPGLPVSMTFGIIFALEKLKNKQIFCISPNKIISGGQVKHACFDKTGTLTEDFMDLYGIVPCSQKKMYPFIQSVEQKQGKFKFKIQDTFAKNPHIGPALGNMATNHSIIQIQNTNELVGDPMQIKLFQFGQFQLDFSQNNPDIVFSFSSKRNHKGVIYRRFEFDSDVQRMSVIASNTMMDSGYYCYCKGSPEIMLQIMNKSSIPENYQQVLKQYASSGFRVLAIASKKITTDPKNVQRQDAQSELDFDGFEIFENKLKRQTYDAIQDLKGAQITCIMITGDNPLTGSNIAYKCQIANLNKKMMICDFKNGKFSAEEFIYNESEINLKNKKEYLQKKKQLEGEISPQISKQNIQMIQTQGIQLKTSIQCKTQSAGNFSSSLYTVAEQFMKEMVIKTRNQNFQICLTGSAFNQLLGTHMNSIKQDQLRKEFVNEATVYARTKPNDKARIVSLYQNLGKIVSMCGDGANDCGALKQADVGLSLSQAQASISAPFTSKVINISAVVQLIKQCRAGLATNFSLFNIMASYSLVQYTSTIIAQFFYAYPSDFHYLYWDLAGNFFFFLTFGYTGTVKNLSKHIPSSSLFSFTNIFQIVIMFAIQIIGQISMILALGGMFNQDVDYNNTGGQQINKAKYLQQQDFLLDTPQTNIIFLFTNFMYIFTLLAYSISKPWRKQFWTNIPFMIVLVVVFVYSVLITVVPDARLILFELSWMNSDRLNCFVLGIALLFSLFIYGAQKFILEPGSTWLKEKYPQKTWL